MRQHGRMRLCMGQIERAAERVAELVVERHADGAEAGSAEPGAVERIGPCLPIRGPFDHDRQRARQGADGFIRHDADERIAVLRVERFDGMGDRVDAAGARNRRRQAQRQGRHRRSRPRAGPLGLVWVTFWPSRVSPRIGVISDPA